MMGQCQNTGLSVFKDDMRRAACFAVETLIADDDALNLSE